MSRPVLIATERNQQQFGRNPKYSVYFDWMGDNFTAGISGYDRWLQCYEYVPASGTVEESYIPIGDLTGSAVIDVNSENAFILYPKPDNIGTGTIEQVRYLYPGEGEKITAISLDREEDGVCSFAVMAQSKLIGILDDAELGVPYGFDDDGNGYIQFVPQGGAVPFVFGDSFEIYPALTTRELNQSVTITSYINDYSTCKIDGGPDFLYWDTINWISEGDVRVFIRSATEEDQSRWSEWYEYNKGDIISSEQARRYLQVKVILNSTATAFAKIANLSVSYIVKSHTNNVDSFTHESGFNDIVSIRVSRSKEFITSGYAAADCDIVLNNSHRLYSKENSGSKYFGLLVPNLRFIIEIGFSEQTLKKIEAFATDFKLDTSARTVNVRGQDYVKRFLAKKIEVGDISSRVFINKPLKFLISMISIDAGFPIDRIAVDDISTNSLVPYAYFKGKQAWQELQDLLLAYECEVYISEDGYLVVRDRFKKKTMHSSIRDSAKNIITSIVKNETSDDVFFVVYSKEYANAFLYLYNGEYTNLDTGLRGICYCKDDVVSDYASLYATKDDSIIRVTTDSDIPLLEEFLRLKNVSLTNSITYVGNESATSKYLYGIGFDGSSYFYYRYRILDSENNVIYPTNNLTSYFLYPFDSNNVAQLRSGSLDIKYTTLYAKNQFTGVETVLVYSLDWIFTDDNYTAIKILRNYSSAILYTIRYVPADNVEPLTNGAIDYYAGLSIPHQGIADNIFSRSIIANTFDNDGSVFLINMHSSPTMTLTAWHYPDNAIPQFSYQSSDLERYCGGCCDSSKGRVYLFIKKTTGEIVPLYFDISDITHTVYEADEILYIDEALDPALNVYDVAYNEKDKNIMLSVGYEEGVNRFGAIYKYRQSYVNARFENTVGKPLSKVVVRDDTDTASVVEKQYNVFFQKRGGIGAITSQIWAWFSTARVNEDKLKCALYDKTCIAVPINTDLNGFATEFELPASPLNNDVTISAVEYIYISDPSVGWENIGNNFEIDQQTGVITLYSKVNTLTTQVKAGTGKIIKKYFGEYLIADANKVPNWIDLNLVVMPYKPSRLRFSGTNLIAGNIQVTGFGIGGTPLSETLAYDPVIGFVETVGVYNKDYYGDISINATGVFASNAILRVESTYEDLIPGIDIYIYINPDETEEQFGGDGMVTSFNNEVAIYVSINNGFELATKTMFENAVTGLYSTVDGLTYGATSYIGRFLVYSETDIDDAVYDFELKYDTNLTKLDYEWGTSDIKNSITVTAKKKEISPFREFEIMTGAAINSIPMDSPIRDWAKLEILYKSQSPQYIAPGLYSENDVNFSNPVLTTADNMLRFNAHISDYAGIIRSNDLSQYYVDLNFSEHPELGFSGSTWPSSVEFGINTAFIGTSGSFPFIDPFTGESYDINVFEAEKRNFEIYLGSKKLYLVSGEYDVIFNDPDCYIQVDMRPEYVGRDLVIHYPMRWEITRDTLSRNINDFDIDGDERNRTRSYVYDVPYGGMTNVGSGDSRLKYYYANAAGFQLNVFWPNRTTFAETSYLRIENPAINALDAYYDPEANPSGWSVWIDKVEIRGLPVIESPVTVAAAKDLESIELYFEQSHNIDNEYIQSIEEGTKLAKYLLKNLSKPITKPSIQILGVANMELGDVLKIYDPNSALDGDYFEVLGITDNLSVDAAYLQDITVQKTSDRKTGLGQYSGSKYSIGYRYR